MNQLSAATCRPDALRRMCRQNRKSRTDARSGPAFWRACVQRPHKTRPTRRVDYRRTRFDSAHQLWQGGPRACKRNCHQSVHATCWRCTAHARDSGADDMAAVPVYRSRDATNKLRIDIRHAILNGGRDACRCRHGDSWDHRRRSSVNFEGSRKFCPKIMLWQ